MAGTRGSSESFAVLIVEEERSRLTRFHCEVRGETLWASGPGELARHLRETPPRLVAVAGERHVAQSLADDLRRRKVAKSVFVITPAAEGEAVPPGQVPVTLPRSVDELAREELVPCLLEAILSAYARLPVSPLTNLPGSAVLRQEVEQRLLSGQPFAFLYLDLDNFKAYNDVYGFGRGDLVIQMLARHIARACRTVGSPDTVCVHIGGDDFAIVTPADRAAPLAEAIIAAFDREAPSFYSEEARAAGYIETKSRRGEPTRYPLVSLSVGGVDTARRRLQGYLHLTEIAAEVKAYAKSQEGSHFAMDRRND